MMDDEERDAGARQLRIAEFARMSTSKKLSLFAIRKAQLSSRDRFAAVTAIDIQKRDQQELDGPAD